MRVIVPLLLLGCVPSTSTGPGEARSGEARSGEDPPGQAPPADDPLVEVHADDVTAAASDTDATLASADLPGPGGARVLAHLEGCWQATSPRGDRWLVQYTRPVAGLVLGVTRHLRGDRMILDEVERFHIEEDGTLVVTPIANGVPRDTFAYDPETSRRGDVSFVRRGEGFPQRLRYRRSGDVLDVIARDDEQALGIKLRPGACL